MGSDRARVSFDPSRQWRAVVAQQGRVSLEADWNEQVAIAAARDELTMLEVIGPCGSPDGGYVVTAIPDSGGPSGFTPGDLTISAGTLYLGGQRLELASQVTYSEQPDWLDDALDPLYVAPAVPSGTADELVYLLATEQEVSAVEDPALLDVAIGGPDTAQRLRVLQRIVRTPVQSSGCATAWSELQALFSASGFELDAATMQLTSTASLVVSFPKETSTIPEEPTTPSLCQPVATGGYLGAENQLIRVAIASVDSNDVPTIVWGYDDACFLFRVTAATYDAGSSTTTLTIAGTPVDSTQYPAAGQVVELLADAVELTSSDYVAAPTGFLTTLATTYDPTSGTLVLQGEPPTGYLGGGCPQLYVRIWQQLATSPAGSATSLGDNGVAVTLASSDATFHAGDFWRFALRPIDPTTVYPARIAVAADGTSTPQPADGPRTWACPLAVVSWSNGTPTSASCVPSFANLVTLSEEAGGCCTISLRPSDVEDGATLTARIAGYASQGATTICLDPGTYTLSAPIVLGQGFDGLTISGCRGGVVLAGPASPGPEFQLGLVVIEGAASVSLEGLELQPPLVAFTPASGAFAGLSSENQTLLDAYATGLQVAIGVSALGATDLTISDCSFGFPAFASANVFGAGVYASGTVTGMSLTGCQFSTSGDATTMPFADLARGNETEPPYQVTFGYLHVPTSGTVTTTTTSSRLGTAALAQAGDLHLEVDAAAAAIEPTIRPTLEPTISPTIEPTIEPTISPTIEPTIEPTFEPTISPTIEPTIEPTFEPTLEPTIDPTISPTIEPTIEPTFEPTIEPTIRPTIEPTIIPTIEPTISPTIEPTVPPPVLHDAAIEGNIFEGLAVPVLVVANLGSVRVDRNTIRSCYGGIWLVSYVSADVLVMFDRIANGDSDLWSEFNTQGRASMLDRLYVIALAMAEVLPTTPPTDIFIPIRLIPVPIQRQLTNATQLISRLYALSTSESSTTPSTPPTGGTTSSSAEDESDEVRSPSPSPDEAARGAGNTRIDIHDFPVIHLPTIIQNAFTNVGIAGTVNAIPVGETGTDIMLRLDIADNQIDAVLADSYSGAGVVALDLTATPGSLLVHDNRVRDRFPQGETMLVSGVAEATVTGNLVANEVVNVTTPTAVLPQSRSLSLLPTDLLAVPAVAITGNVLVDPAMLPQRTALDQQSIAAVFQVWDFLNTITAYVAPASPSASPSSPSATPSVAPT